MTTTVTPIDETTETSADLSGQVIVSDRDRRENYYIWAAYQEGDWQFFGVPKDAHVRLRRLEHQKSTSIEWGELPLDEMQ